ncbi:hypothetical protein Tco_0774096 [Tanacetum coccineum]|uniref:Integrase, catalytic region, zinc finger, CCHC-type, peptidase aspartic, catalytic n=1 Tax=Tanacetum coccineum TaxID=301880 RepID=A0ABQ4ZNG8_9ASTR
MSTLTHDVLTAGSDNRSPMLEKSSYDSWQSRMLMHIEGKENGHSNEIRAERAIRNHDLLALVANTYNPPSTYNNPPPQSNQVFKAFTTEYPATNNHLRTSSNPRTQANVQDGRVTIQNVQGRQTKSYGNNGKGKVAGMDAIKTVGDYAEANAVKQRKKKKGYTYEEEHDFMADLLESFVDCEEELNTTLLFMADCVDAFDSYCNEDATSEIFMANISHARRVTNNNVGPSYDTYALS